MITGLPQTISSLILISLLLSYLVAPSGSFTTVIKSGADTTTRSAPENISSRRAFFVSTSLLLPIISCPEQSHSLTLFGGEDRRELAFCLVDLIRVKYWVESLASRLDAQQDDLASIRNLYVEARLGAKAAVTGKIGGGANSQVYTIASLKFRESLDDLAWYAEKAKKKRAVQLKDDLVESLASIVEFDGLETTQDPSPRSSLMFNMFDSQKLSFVKRMLTERVLPTATALLKEFDDSILDLSLNYVSSNYPNEVPRQPQAVLGSNIAATE